MITRDGKNLFLKHQEILVLKVRRFQPEDFPRVVELERMCFGDAPTLYVNLYRMHEGFFVAELDGYVVAFVVAAFTEDGDGRVLSLAVDERFRRRGIATALMEHVFDYYRQRGIGKVKLEVRVSNLPARKLYEKLGFRAAGMIRNYYADGEDAFVMVKWISPL